MITLRKNSSARQQETDVIQSLVVAVNLMKIVKDTKTMTVIEMIEIEKKVDGHSRTINQLVAMETTAMKLILDRREAAATLVLLKENKGV